MLDFPWCKKCKVGGNQPAFVSVRGAKTCVIIPPVTQQDRGLRMLLSMMDRVYEWTAADRDVIPLIGCALPQFIEQRTQAKAPIGLVRACGGDRSKWDPSKYVNRFLLGPAVQMAIVENAPNVRVSGGRPVRWGDGLDYILMPGPERLYGVSDQDEARDVADLYLECVQRAKAALK